MTDSADQGQTVHIGHPDIRHHHIRFQLFNLFQGILSVLRISHHLKSGCFPVDFLDYALSYFLLVVYKDNAV